LCDGPVQPNSASTGAIGTNGVSVPPGGSIVIPIDVKSPGVVFLLCGAAADDGTNAVVLLPVLVTT
jgi:hypothetical protein